ncbi:MAG: hypothetical protein GW867_29605 [Armatimonadetes bacterium]|nr:hypothetical protein [Armatimonadota bacterium]
MPTAQEAQAAVSGLSASELRKFRQWFDEFDARAWDRQIERDARSGKLDALAAQALVDFHAGKCREL